MCSAHIKSTFFVRLNWLITHQDNQADKKENIYKRVNSCLRVRLPEDLNKWKHYIWHLIKGIRHLEKVTSIVYRGINKSNFTPELYQTGKRVVWNSVTSCSQQENVVKSSMKVCFYLHWQNMYAKFFFWKGYFKRDFLLHQGFWCPQTWTTIFCYTRAGSVVGTRLRICCYWCSFY